jgi:hypothetical protein
MLEKALRLEATKGTGFAPSGKDHLAVLEAVSGKSIFRRLAPFACFNLARIP